MPKVVVNVKEQWNAWADVCRWGIVLVALVLVPGVAVLGQGIGRWLRTKSDSGWAVEAIRISPGHRDEPPSAAPLVAMTPTVEVPTSPEQSAAMYDGSRPEPPIRASFADFETNHDPADGDLLPAAHREESEGIETPIEGFAELEQRLQSLGAEYYALEADRHSGYSYRFECIMPAASGNGAQERFAAPGRTPIEAVQGVLRQLADRPAVKP